MSNGRATRTPGGQRKNPAEIGLFARARTPGARLAALVSALLAGFYFQVARVWRDENPESASKKNSEL
jgi:hypothetical protein